MRKYDLTVNDKSFSVIVRSFSPQRAELEIRGTLYNVRIDDIETEGEVVRPRMRSLSEGAPKSVAPKAAPRTPAAGSSGSLTAPIPGQVLQVLVKAGDTVKSGQPVIKMEAMKMENTVAAHTDGTVASISVSAGDAVSQGQELLVIE